MDFTNREYGRLAANWRQNLRSEGPAEPTISDMQLDNDWLKRLKLLSASYYSNIPMNQITVTAAPPTDCVINFETMATDWLRQNFLKTILFPYNMADFNDYDQDFPDLYDVTNTLFSSDSPDELEAATFFLRNGQHSYTQREFDLVIVTMLNAKTVAELCTIMLNLKRSTDPKNAKLALMLHYGFLIYNARIATYNNKIRDGPYKYTDTYTFFKQATKIEIPEDLKEAIEHGTEKPIYETFYIFRNLIWTKPSLLKDGRKNETQLLEDLDGNMWDLEPLKPHFTLDGYIFKIHRVESEEVDRPRVLYPAISEIMFETKLKFTRKGYALVDTTALRVIQGVKKGPRFIRDMFQGLSKVIVNLDNNKGATDGIPVHHHDMVCQVMPVIVCEKGSQFLMFCERGFHDLYIGANQNHVYPDDPSYLPIFCLHCPDTSILGIDNLLPKCPKNRWWLEGEGMDEENSDLDYSANESKTFQSYAALFYFVRIFWTKIQRAKCQKKTFYKNLKNFLKMIDNGHWDQSRKT